MIQTRAATETITAADLQPGDVVVRIPRDNCGHGLTAGRARIEEAEPFCPGGTTEYVWLAFSYRSNRCECSATPYRCPHYGEAGVGTGRVLASQRLDRYVR